MRTTADRKERRLAIVVTKKERVAQTLKVNPIVKMQFPKDQTDPATGEKFLRELEFTNRAAINILEDCGVNILKDRITQAAFDPRFLTCVLYHGLKKHWPEVSKDALDDGDLFDIHHFPYIFERLASALEVIMPDVEDLDAEEKAMDEEEKQASPLATTGAGSIT